MTALVSEPQAREATRAFLRLIRPRPLADPYPEYRLLRELAPVHRVRLPGLGESWVSATHAEVALLLRDRRFVPLSPGHLDVLSPGWRHRPFTSCMYRAMAFRHGGEHRASRGLVAADFAVRATLARRTMVAGLADELLDSLEQGDVETDLVESLALPFGALTIGRTLGIPDDTALELARLFRTAGIVFEPMATAAQRAAQHQAGEQMLALLRALLADRRHTPQNDLLSRLAHHPFAPFTPESLPSGSSPGSRTMPADRSPGPLEPWDPEQEALGPDLRDPEQEALNSDPWDPEQEALSAVTMLFGAGSDSPVSMVGLGTLLLLEHPDQAALLRATPSLAGSAADEILRYEPPVQLVVRSAHEPATLAGTPIPEGGVVFGLLASANRDPQAITHPDSFDITRPPTPALTFGAGAHYCLGAPLARLQAELLFPRLLRRFPTLRLAGTPHHRTPGTMLRGLDHLPLALR